MADKFNPPKDISKMDFKELREEVQLLRDELARMKRGYEDAIYNLDYDNFSSRVMKDQKGMQTSIEQTAEKITLQAEAVKELDDKVIATQASITVKADEILSTVSETYQTKADAKDKANKLESQISQTADSIKTVVNATYGSAAETVESFNENRADKDKIYYDESTEKYRIWNGDEWIESGSANFGTVFEQTATSFKLKGNVQISGNAVVGGTISGTRISDSSNSYYVEMSNANDFGAFRLYDNGNDNSVPIFSIWDNKTGGIGLMSNGESFLLASNVGNEPFAYPQGNWNFLNCTITNWGNNAPVAVFG